MKVKKYVAASMQEAMKTIRAELGNDAVILNSKIVQTGGFFGFFKKRNIEVIAAVDPKVNVEMKPTVKVKPKIPVESVQMKPVPLEDKMEPVRPSNELLKEISELKMFMQQMSNGNNQTQLSYPEPLKGMENLLRDQEIDGNLTAQFLQELLEKWYINGANVNVDIVKSWLRDSMIERVSNIEFKGITFTKRFVNVVGPTGVGKTTTLAKIAASCVLNDKKKVAFITTDTYRIAAIDQLKTYAKILNVPLEVCYNLEDFQKATEKFHHYDTVLIDTAGRNFRNRHYVDELSKLLNFDNKMETFLVLSLTSKQRDMEEIFKQFSIVPINKFIFTKADETSNYGAMYNLVDKYKKGIAYITYGQNVPDDMVQATPEEVTNKILGVE